MSPVIKIRSKAVKPAGKPAATSKAKPAAKKTPPAKKNTKKPAAAKKEPTRRRPKIDPAIIAKYERELKAVGKKRDDALRAHEAAVEQMYETVQEAMDQKVPMSVISASAGVSRQWLYKMSSFKGRENGGAPKKKRGRPPKAATQPATPAKTAPAKNRSRVKIKI